MLIFNFWGRMSAKNFFLWQFFISLGKPKFDIRSFFLGHLILGESCFYSQCESQEMHSRMSWNSMLSHHFFFLKSKKDWKTFLISVYKAVITKVYLIDYRLFWWKIKLFKRSKRVNSGFGSFINDCPSGLYVEKVKKCTVGWTEIPCCHIIFFSLN